MRVKDVIKATKGKLVWGEANDYFRGVSIDTRTIKPDELFIPLKGKRFNGHQFIPQALSKGAGGVLYSDIHPVRYLLSKEEKFVIQVKDTLEALGQLANFYREKYNPKVIAITGSVGKTTTKNLIAKILSYKFKVYKTLGTQNNFIGVSINILRAPKISEILILELGTNKPGEISKLSQICEPDIGIVLNIGPSHLEYLKSIQGVKEEKLSLFDHIKTKSYSIINSDYINKHDVKDVNRDKIITIGVQNDADFKASHIEYLNGGINFKVNGIKFFAPFTNKEYIYNILACLAVVSIFDIDIELVKETILNFTFSPNRFQKVKVRNNTIIDDTYNSNPMSMECALGGILNLNGYDRKIVICGDMLELGKYSEEYHLRVGRQIANAGINLLYLLGNYSKYVAQGALSEGMESRYIKIFPNLNQACREIPFYIKEKDLILVKGSRATGMDRIVEELKRRL